MRRHLDGRMSVSGQIGPEDVADLAAGGVTVLINNRPDDEEPGQPSGAAIARAAESAGMTYVAAPFRGRPPDEAVEAVRAALASGEGQVHAYCKSGLRSCAAWGLSQVTAGRPADEVIAAGREAGYDLAPLFF